jgi:hypothetical protein
MRGRRRRRNEAVTKLVAHRLRAFERITSEKWPLGTQVYSGNRKPETAVYRYMRRLAVIVIFGTLLAPAPHVASQPLTEQSLRAELVSHAVPLRSGGVDTLIKEANEHQYFLLGELHGENEIPELVSEMWPALWRANYRYVAAEVSPWAVTHLESPAAVDRTPVPGLWTRAQAASLHQLSANGRGVLWGCDIEEMQPDQLIRQLAQLNPADDRLRKMVTKISGGYSRKQAPALLELAGLQHPAHDRFIGGESLWQSMIDTLQVEALRSDFQTRYAASDARERVMKDLFRNHRKQEPTGKVLLRFGRNHLHRGIDARGISTLGNFVSEWALAQGQTVVNVGAFAAGGEEHLAGKTFSADERQDEATFALLAELAGKETTLFDLRDLRSRLHTIPLEKRTGLEENLIYWADSYDFLLCFPTVTPLTDISADAQ